MGVGIDENIHAMKNVLRMFELISGLKINLTKSSPIGVNTSVEWLESMAAYLGCKKGETPFSYHGLPVGANPRLSTTWKRVIEAVRKKLASWNPNTLSFGARIVLVKVVLSLLPTYFFSLFKAPKNT